MRTAEKRLSGSRCVRMKYVKTAVWQLPAETLQLLCVVEGQQGVIDASEVITLASVSWVLPLGSAKPQRRRFFQQLRHFFSVSRCSCVW